MIGLITTHARVVRWSRAIGISSGGKIAIMRRHNAIDFRVKPISVNGLLGVAKYVLVLDPPPKIDSSVPRRYS